MPPTRFDFEKPVADLEQEADRLRQTENPTADQRQALTDLEQRLDQTRREIYASLTPWQRVQLARHLQRPHALDYIMRIFTDWTELHGDRFFGDDKACVAGFALFGEQAVAVIGQQKGRDVRENVTRNFAQMHPEGYRKALRVMRLAEKFNRPVVAFIDTQGAYPGIGAEERSVAEAIATNLMEMSALRVPIVCIVIGEGGSGGALGIGVGDRILMQENAYYSVITPEGCASILWRDAKYAPQAAESLRMTARDLLALGVIDEIVSEPLGGAHNDSAAAIASVREALERNLRALQQMDVEDLLQARFEKFRKMGVFEEAGA